MFIFNHCPQISRVVFISTPHRGSPLATSWIGRIGASLIRQPQSFTSLYAEVKPLLVHDSAAAPFNRIPSSVDTLEPNDRFLRSLNKIPIAPDIPYHSIMGDHGRGDTPNSSDGIVPYWSSHLAGAQSELVVHSGHMAQRNPDAIVSFRIRSTSAISATELNQVELEARWFAMLSADRAGYRIAWGVAAQMKKEAKQREVSISVMDPCWFTLEILCRSTSTSGGLDGVSDRASDRIGRNSHRRLGSDETTRKNLRGF